MLRDPLEPKVFCGVPEPEGLFFQPSSHRDVIKERGRNAVRIPASIECILAHIPQECPTEDFQIVLKRQGYV